MDNNNNNIHEVKHTVYISFDNNDSSVSSFISYLIAAFERQGISAFVDGKTSNDEAVEREMEHEPFSKLSVFIVVFSKNYAFFHVEKQILEYSYRNNNDFLVVPVFYGVSISSVEQHRESFGDAFEADRRSMIKWQPGYEYDFKQRESEFLEEIARDLFEKLYPTEEIGIQSPLKELENLLCNQPWGVRTIGIFGEPRIGKTTLARAFFRRISHGYDNSCFIKDFQKEYNEKRLCLPLEYLLSKTPMEKLDRKCFDSQPSHREEVLIALDDVRNAQDAKSYLGGYDKFGPGSLIIITSEKRKVLEQCQMNEIYELKGLKDEDALKLFTRCAFGNGLIKQNLLDLSMRVVEFSDGKPHVLRSYAEKLMVKAMVELGRAIPDDCDVFVTGHDGSCDTEKNTYLRITPCEEDNEPQETKEFPSDRAFLTNGDTKTIILTPSHLCAELEFQSYSQKNPEFGLYNRITKSLPSNLKAEDALKLFTRCAFGNGVIKQNLLDLSMRVVESSDGKPHVRRSCAVELMVKAMVELGWAILDDCDVFVTGHNGSCDTEKNTYLRITPYEEDNELQETKESPSDRNAFLTNEDTKTISHLCAELESQSYSQKNPGFGLSNRITKSLLSNLIPLDYYCAMRPF